MSWYFETTELRLGDDELGEPFITATAMQKARFRTAGTLPEAPAVDMRRWDSQSASVSIYPHSTSDWRIDPAGEGFLEIIKAKQDLSFARIQRFSEEESEICAAFYFPTRRFHRIWRMGEVFLLSQKKLLMSIAIESVIFDVEINEEHNTPTFAQFLQGVPYTGSEITVQISSA